mgnify:CR=1 FL=1
MGFASLHNHSDHSLRDGFQTVEQMLQYASSIGQSAIALTDHGTMSGCGEGFRLKSTYGIKFIAGCEHYLCNDVTLKEKGVQHIILLVMDKTGYRNLNILTTKANSEKNFYNKPRLDLELLEQYNEGLICSTACLAGCQSKIKELKKIFGDRLYVELHTNSLPEQIEKNHEWLELANQNDVPFYAAVDAHYTLQSQAPYQQAWSPYGYDMPPDLYLHTEEEVREALKYLPQDIVDLAVNTTQAVADRCTFDITWGGNYYPKSKYDDPKREVRMRTWQGCKEHGVDKNEKHIKQIRHEIDVLEKVGYFDYFLIVSDMLNWCKSCGILTGVGRGSVVGCDVAYQMGITKIDPIEHGLIFERFAHTERVTPADIDNDIPRTRRQEVIQYLKDTYGYVYQVATFNRMGEKAAIRRAAQSFKMTPEQVNSLCEKFPTIEALISCDEFDSPLFMPGEFEYFKKTAQQFLGKMQNFGTHASAVVVITTDPYDFCAVERFSGTAGPQYNLNYDFHDLEAMGLLKLDILGLETLDVITDTLAQLPEGERPNIERLSDMDKKTFDLLNRGLMAGLFQLEGNTVRGVLKKMRPEKINDLTDIVALGRPGTMDSGATGRYLYMKEGKKENTTDKPRPAVFFNLSGRPSPHSLSSIHPKIKEDLSGTYGELVYQEQCMQLVQSIWGVSLGKADMIRRAIGRKDPELMKKLIEEMKNTPNVLGLSDDEIEKVLNTLNIASSYLFNKSHSAAYAYTAYQTAYLKAHYPLQFYAALLNSNIDQEKALGYIKEVKREHIEIVPPNVLAPESKWTTDGEKIYAGFSYIRSVGEREIKPVTNKSEEGIKQFLEENKTLNKLVCDNIVKAGCFDIDTEWGLAYVDWFKSSGKRKEYCEERIEHYTKEGKQKSADSWRKKMSEIPEPPKTGDFDTPIEKTRSYQVEVLGMSNRLDFDSYKKNLLSRGTRMVWVRSKRMTNAKKDGSKMVFLEGTTPSGDYTFIFYRPKEEVEKFLASLQTESMTLIRCGNCREGSFWCTDITNAEKIA